jgi:ER lumen protein retaining receptor
MVRSCRDLAAVIHLQRTGKTETITTHYLFALGIYRALYILNWIWRFFTDSLPHRLEPVAILAGVMQTILYSDFFYLYYTK